MVPNQFKPLETAPLAGDYSNGVVGSMTPASQVNATQQKKVTGNPFSDALEGAATWQPLNLLANSGNTPSSTGNPFAEVYGNSTAVPQTTGVLPAFSGASFTPTPAAPENLAPPYAEPASGAGPISMPPTLSSPQAQIPAPQLSSSSNASFSAEPDKTRAVETPTDPLYQKLYEYAAQPGYEYLKDQPDLLRGYYQYVDDLRTRLKQVGFNGTGADRLDFVDYLKHKGQASPLASRAGYDTWIDMPDAPEQLGWIPSGGTGGGILKTIGDPNQGVDPAIVGLAQSYAQADPHYGWLMQTPSAVQDYQTWAFQSGNTDTDIVDWLAHQDVYGSHEHTLAGRRGYDTFLYKKDANGQLVPRDNHAADTPPPAATPPPVTSTPPPAVAPPPPPTTAAGPAADIQSLIDIYRKQYQSQQPDIEGLLNPMFARQRQLAIGDLNADAAATGLINSGGFGETKGQAISDLAAKQSGILADYTSKQNLAQMEQNTALAQLSTTAGMQQFLGVMNDQLQRDNVRTNADLQKWLSNADNAIKAKGIDSQAVWEKYAADIGLQGKQIDANASIDVAKLQAAAAHAAANAQARASAQSAELQHKLGLEQLGVARENNIGNFILGLLGLGISGVTNLDDILKQLPTGLTVTTP